MTMRAAAGGHKVEKTGQSAADHNRRSFSGSVITMSLFVYLLLALTFTSVPAWALRCWECYSYEDGHCADPFNGTLTVQWQDECKLELRDYTKRPYDVHAPYPKSVCKKVLQREHGRLVYIRSCGVETWPGDACATSEHTPSIPFCGTCDTNNCNVAATLTLSHVTLLLVPLLKLVSQG